MTTCFYISHPEVRVDRALPVPEWGLSETGAARMRQFACRPLLDHVTAIRSSPETKAREAAGILSKLIGVSVTIGAHLGENDRSATGFLPPEEFERAANAFFAHPETSFRGWERAIDAQRRVVGAVQAALAEHLAGPARDGDLAIIGHGGVGTLLYCHLASAPIHRRYDQPGQGHYFAFDILTRHPRHGWRVLEG